MKNTLVNYFLLLMLAGWLMAPASFAATEQTVAKDTRCAVCGMFVAKYPNWLTTLTMSDGETKHFDGVKDMMVFYFAPQKYGAKAGATTTEIQVNDYYTLSPVDAKKAWYVIGSDVTGPMGHEFIPFATKDAADSFSQDHHGKKIQTFAEITAEQVESLRSGQRMQ